MLKRALGGVILIAILSSCSASPKNDNPVSRTGTLQPSTENTATAIIVPQTVSGGSAYALTGVTPERAQELMGKVVRVNGSLSKTESAGLQVIMVHDIEPLASTR